MKSIRNYIITLLAALWVFAPAVAFAQASQLPPAEQCFQALTPTSGGPGGTGTGFVGLLGTITGGSGGTTGTYGGVPLTGGYGTGATANITVAGGAVTAVAILNPGLGYVVGDVLTAAAGTIGGTSGFSVPVSSVYINESLAGGSVYYYIPNTNTYKQTWFSAAASNSTQNTNPVKLDANGCATVYGTGIYRQVLQDSLGNTIWDMLTTAPGSVGSIYWAGQATGTPNIIVVSNPGFTNQDGFGLQFLALSTNTGPITVNSLSVDKPSANGPILLAAGDIQPGNLVYLVYSAAQNFWQLVDQIPTAATVSGSLFVGAEISCRVFTPPANYMFEYGQFISRGTYAALMAALTFGQSGTLTATSPTITGISDTSQMFNGEAIEGTGIPGGTTILSFTPSTIVMSAPATASLTTTVTVFPYGDGDGSMTFNLPDLRGNVVAGRDNMGGTARSLLTAAYAGGNPDSTGSEVGSQTQTLAQANLPNANFTVSGITLTNDNGQSGPGTNEYTVCIPAGGCTHSSTNYALNVSADYSNAGPIPTWLTTNVSVATQGTAASGGSSSPFPTVQPSLTSNMCIKVQ